ncbi:hypothetical protein GUITHDRAFT_142102 [Guillardia theta CCMP2712]|uniref:RRM domain-containing protein n=1 Tax=Guillardia theta (strain CCMP2712) TaxID=905079 RepID=L1J014_GUITC|nr:hypothetical protein GUITHDRAFT_142102 [Guillardia theta CCMP2712]EKX41420.1 hypothetical protein GUITHDRAFT_142102 [Guillardia theta CCMP2712]|eukprot:XP_005828400.1 hypothetical protein GUITHDRAFT_142102 [Guillardia theta CCMP2712]
MSDSQDTTANCSSSEIHETRGKKREHEESDEEGEVKDTGGQELKLRQDAKRSQTQRTGQPISFAEPEPGLELDANYMAQMEQYTMRRPGPPPGVMQQDSSMKEVEPCYAPPVDYSREDFRREFRGGGDRFRGYGRRGGFNGRRGHHDSGGMPMHGFIPKEMVSSPRDHPDHFRRNSRSPTGFRRFGAERDERPYMGEGRPGQYHTPYPGRDMWREHEGYREMSPDLNGSHRDSPPRFMPYGGHRDHAPGMYEGSFHRREARSKTLVITNLPQNISPDRVKDAIFLEAKRHGRIINLSLQPRGPDFVAYLTYVDPDKAEAARRYLDRILLFDTRIEVSIEPPFQAPGPHIPEQQFARRKHDSSSFDDLDDPNATCRISILGADENVQEVDILPALRPFGSIENIQIQRMNGQKRDGQVLPGFSAPSKVEFSMGQPSHELWLGSVHPTVTEAMIRQELDAFGPLRDVKLLRGSKSAFVSFASVRLERLRLPHVTSVIPSLPVATFTLLPSSPQTQVAEEAARYIRGRTLGGTVWRVKVDFWERNVDRPFFRGPGAPPLEQDRDFHPAGGARPPKFQRVPAHGGAVGGAGEVTIVVSTDHLLSDKVLATHFQQFGKVSKIEKDPNGLRAKVMFAKQEFGLAAVHCAPEIRDQRISLGIVKVELETENSAANSSANLWNYPPSVPSVPPAPSAPVLAPTPSHPLVPATVPSSASTPAATAPSQSPAQPEASAAPPVGHVAASQNVSYASAGGEGGAEAAAAAAAPTSSFPSSASFSERSSELPKSQGEVSGLEAEPPRSEESHIEAASSSSNDHAKVPAFASGAAPRPSNPPPSTPTRKESSEDAREEGSGGASAPGEKKEEGRVVMKTQSASVRMQDLLQGQGNPIVKFLPDRLVVTQRMRLETEQVQLFSDRINESLKSNCSSKPSFAIFLIRPPDEEEEADSANIRAQFSKNFVRYFMERNAAGVVPDLKLSKDNSFLLGVVLRS